MTDEKICPKCGSKAIIKRYSEILGNNIDECLECENEWEE